MAGRHFFPARTIGGTVPDTKRRVYKSGETWAIGALMVFDANGELVECGADPSLISGVAAQASDTGPGFAMADSPSVITYRALETTIFEANRNTVFSGRGVNGGTDPVTPTQTMLDTQFGVAVDANGIWVVDIADTTNLRVEIVDIDIDNKIFYFKFLEAVLSLP
jgi:hypothetical protein